MSRHGPEKVLLIGDTARQMQTALAAALPLAQVTCVGSVFEGLGELSDSSYSAVLAAAEPIERRPEPAVRALRELAGSGRLILFGHPTLEILSRKMLQFGCDDYLITPPDAAELQHIFGKPLMRISAGEGDEAPVAEQTERGAKYSNLPLAEIFLEAMLQHPHDAPSAAVNALNRLLEPDVQLRYIKRGQTIAEGSPANSTIVQPVQISSEQVGSVCATCDAQAEKTIIEPLTMRIAHLLSQAAALQDRHNRLQKLAVTDDLTGLYNARYFNHFLVRIVERARAMRFPVTLLLFDIDDFKKYNDQYGHGAGDEILKQTAQLIRRCCRTHDVVARIGGDEFAVVFWDKEGPRQPKDANKAGPSRPPQTPVQIFERFRRLAASSDFSGLGSSGRGRLSVSGGLAVFPYDASDAAGLIKAADDYLMFKAKRAGKNSVYLVEEQEPDTPNPS